MPLGFIFESCSCHAYRNEGCVLARQNILDSCDFTYVCWLAALSYLNNCHTKEAVGGEATIPLLWLWPYFETALARCCFFLLISRYVCLWIQIKDKNKIGPLSIRLDLQSTCTTWKTVFFYYFATKGSCMQQQQSGKLKICSVFVL